MPARVDILLGTFNGASFLQDQLASLSAQTCRDWRLVWRDDGSADESCAIVEAWAKAQPQQVLRLASGERLGAAGNFAALLAASTAPAFAFCDQDDVWHPDKLARQLCALERCDAVRPALVHCDLRVVGPDLSPRAPSLWALLGARPDAPGAQSGLIVKNHVTGCASLGNRALAKRATPLPEGAALHDWWLALIAAHCGTLIAIPEPLVDYRQHDGNAIGALDWSASGLGRRVLRDPANGLARMRRTIGRSQRQAGAFLDRFSAGLDPAERTRIYAYAALDRASLWQRKLYPIRHGLGLPSRLQTLLYWLFL